MVKKYLHQYAAVVWLPYTKTNIHQLEMIQSKAARFVLNNYSLYSSITEMLNELEWKSLEKRRNETILFMVHKIINQYVDVCYDHILHNGPSTTCSSSRKFLHLPSKIDSSFFQELCIYGIICQITL